MPSFEEYFRVTKAALQSNQATYRFTKPIEDIGRACWVEGQAQQKIACDELIETQAEIVRSVQAENVKIRGALSELVQLKEIKDTYGKTDYYRMTQPHIWEKARQALKKDQS